ncbi:DUF4363 family protein [Oceanobacillus salinisoli]|uniref:DUF4363 family protein n=1 Tax=Oceanobacillus salinisoli TaxID=2678611 RepID=UPI0018CC2946|nr:DUF4363 family protein [Oceanobacillus salinisoli]
MGKIKLLSALVFIFILTSGCDLVKTEKDELLFSSVTLLEEQINKKEWGQAISTIDEFEELYNKRKWKLQLLGELEDYKEIELEILALKESLKEEDEYESKVSLDQIIHRLHLIYNL